MANWKGDFQSHFWADVRWVLPISPCWVWHSSSTFSRSSLKGLIAVATLWSWQLLRLCHMVDKTQLQKSDLAEVLALLIADSVNLDHLTFVKLIFLICEMGLTFRGWTVFLQKICWSSNQWFLGMWPYLELGLSQVNQVKTKSLWGAVIQHDRYHYKKERTLSEDRRKENLVLWKWRQRLESCSPKPKNAWGYQSWKEQGKTLL